MSTFEFNGEKYKQASKHQKEWGNKLISSLKLSGNETILDIGCGEGILTEQLAELVPSGKVVGIDASRGMIDVAKTIERDNLSFLLMDVNDMNFVDQFDIIYSNAALHWVKDHQKLLQSSYKALKTNGRIAWNFAGDGTCALFNETARAMIDSELYREYFQSFEWPWFMPTKTEYEELLADTEFITVSLEHENVDRYFSDAEEMIKWIDQPSIVPFIKQVPASLKDSFRDSFIKLMMEKSLQPDGRCFEHFRRINIQAVK